MSTKFTRGSFQLMKSMNRSIILNMVREEGPISRAAIAKKTSLTPPTVSNIVKELIETKFVIETTQGTSNGGRKPTFLEINADQFLTLGVDVGTVTMKFLVTNLRGDIKHQYALEIPSSPTNTDILDTMEEGIRYLLDKAETPGKFLGIGIGMHGIVDPEQGLSLFAPAFHLRNIPIKETLEKKFKLMVKVENDARAMTLGEYWFGHGNDIDNIVGINVGNGIGAGVMVKGNMFHGFHNLAGEIGHMTVDLSGPKCTCGNYGCLQALSAGPAIAERAKKELKTGRNSKLYDLVEGDLERIDGAIIYEAALENDDLSIELLRQTGRYLGIGLTNLIHTINPERMIIGGGVSKSGSFLLEGLEETIRTRALTEDSKNTSIVLSKLGEHASAIGACVLVLEEFFARSEH
ncbi:ROK family transcriptional regulator [Salimicrobium flavidum]|uniref:Transcriptional regulator, MarR family n=1 Tax=Salimicrobium flavidum TaxID=570947 RepID=A0A1N7IZ17_9BACI|nr:ROK family transcriptional regulator [Salimicrobium flavidum]SIS42289.1 transcriptional regulator, MarR family [Salimicrobium flavidum]